VEGITVGVKVGGCEVDFTTVAICIERKMMQMLPKGKESHHELLPFLLLLVLVFIAKQQK
jgi:hypothetical protein